MLDIILLLIGMGGFGFAGYLDLKHAEFPDILPYGMIILILATRLVFSFYFYSFADLLASILIGLGFLGLGILLFFLKQWGDGDAWLLGVLGFLLPNSLFKIKGSFFPDYVSLLINFFVVSFVYMVGYSLLIGVRNREVRKSFRRKIKGELRMSIAVSVIFLTIYFPAILYLDTTLFFNRQLIYMQILFPLLIIFLLFFLAYAKVVESKLFLRRTDVRKLREGDVVSGGKFRGLTENEIKKLKRNGGYVWVKNGVRFAPVFLITVIISVVFGGLIF